MNNTLSIEERFLEALSKADHTADEVAAEIGEHLLAVRPTATNLKTRGIIARTGEKRRNSVSGKYAYVLTIRPMASVPISDPTPSCNPLVKEMVKQAKDLGYHSSEIKELLSEQPLQDVETAIKQVYGQA